MKALLMKDYSSIEGQLKIYLTLPLMAAFFCYQNHSLSFMQFMMSMIVIFIPLSAFAYDDACSFHAYALTLPVTRKDLVLSRYIMSALSGLLVAVIAILGAFIMTTIFGTSYFEGFEWKSYILSQVVIFVALNALNCFLLPLIYKFGTEKARIFLMIIFLSFAILIYFVQDPIMVLLTTPITLLAWGAAIVAILLEVGSIMVSNRIMANKEF